MFCFVCECKRVLRLRLRQERFRRPRWRSSAPCSTRGSPPGRRKRPGSPKAERSSSRPARPPTLRGAPRPVARRRRRTRALKAGLAAGPAQGAHREAGHALLAHLGAAQAGRRRVGAGAALASEGERREEVWREVWRCAATGEEAAFTYRFAKYLSRDDTL